MRTLAFTKTQNDAFLLLKINYQIYDNGSNKLLYVNQKEITNKELIEMEEFEEKEGDDGITKLYGIETVTKNKNA